MRKEILPIVGTDLLLEVTSSDDLPDGILDQGESRPLLEGAVSQDREDRDPRFQGAGAARDMNVSARGEDLRRRAGGGRGLDGGRDLPDGKGKGRGEKDLRKGKAEVNRGAARDVLV